MPVSLSIRNVSDEVVERLRKRAKKNHRSLQGELLDILENTLLPRKLSVKDAYSQIKEMGFHTKSEAVDIVRKERDAR